MKTVMTFSIAGLGIGEMCEASAQQWLEIEGSGYYVHVNCKGRRMWQWPTVIKFIGKDAITINPTLSEITLAKAHMFFGGHMKADPHWTYVNWCLYVDELVEFGAVSAWAADGWRESFSVYNVKNINWTGARK